jgi:hypothetical protein
MKVMLSKEFTTKPLVMMRVVAVDGISCCVSIVGKGFLMGMLSRCHALWLLLLFRRRRGTIICSGCMLLLEKLLHPLTCLCVLLALGRLSNLRLRLRYWPTCWPGSLLWMKGSAH